MRLRVEYLVYTRYSKLKAYLPYVSVTVYLLKRNEMAPVCSMSHSNDKHAFRKTYPDPRGFEFAFQVIYKKKNFKN